MGKRVLPLVSLIPSVGAQIGVPTPQSEQCVPVKGIALKTGASSVASGLHAIRNALAQPESLS